MSRDSAETPEGRVYAARLRALIDATQDAVIFIGQDARITRLNPSAERMFGYAPGELIGEKVDRLMPEPYRHEHDGYIERYQRTGEARAVGRIRRVEAVRKDGTVFPIELSVTNLGDGNDVRYGAFIRDVSIAVELQRQVMHSEKLATIGATTATLAHEIGNPLNNLTIQIRVLERRLARLGLDDEALNESVSTMRADLDRLRRLLGEFRLLARRDDLHKTDCDLRALVSRVTHMIMPSAGAVTVTIDAPEDLPSVPIDADKLTQVFLNLALNAVEAMPGGGELRFVLVRDVDAEQIVVRVSDTGPGLPAGVDVFEPFTTTKPAGTGLGLAIARQLLLSHHGDLRHEPASDQGATFVVEVPLEV